MDDRLYATGTLVFIFCAVVIIIVYLVGSCKLQGVIEAKMAGSTGGDNPTTKSGSNRHIIVKSVAAWSPTIVRKSSSGGAKPRHQHLQTIMQAARAIVACTSAFVVCSIVYATQPRGAVRTAFDFLQFHTAFWTGFVLIRYYRRAIFAGALKKSKSSTAVGETRDMRGTGEMSGEVSNSSVVPVAADIE